MFSDYTITIRKSIVLILILFISHLSSFKSKDFCQMRKKECIGTYNYYTLKYSEVCSFKKCEGHISYHCLGSYCSKTKENCGPEFIAANYLTLIRTRYIEMKLERIRECPIAQKTKINTNQVCLNEKNCKLISHSYEKKVKCQCPKMKSFECVQMNSNIVYCTRDNEVCDILNSNKMKKSSIQKIENCMNGNKT